MDDESFDIRNQQPLTGRERDMENVLRPLRFEDFSGQDKVVDNLRIFVKAARLRGEALDHVLLHGPPGLGKTTLSNIIANEPGRYPDQPGAERRALHRRDTPPLARGGGIPLLGHGGLPHRHHDRQGPVGTKHPDRPEPLHAGGGHYAQRPADGAPLRARFGINLHLEYYDNEVLSGIVRRSAGILNVPCSTKAAQEIASRSRGTPRIANALLRRVRDFAQVKGSGSIDTEIATYALEALNIDRYGLDQIDNKLLTTIIDKFKGGPVGLTTIATALGEDPGTIEEVYEPFLIKEGFIKRTPRGREVTELAYKHLGRSRYNVQADLFSD